MKIDILDAELEARLERQIQGKGAGDIRETLIRLLETQEEQDRWLLENQPAIERKIRTGLEQLDRGEGIPSDRLAAYLAELKAAE